ncbi:MAG: hypothetical protein WCO26_18835, partial [Deltaproteobacteria bacterium]
LVFLHGEDSRQRRGYYHDFTPFARLIACMKTLSSLARKPVLSIVWVRSSGLSGRNLNVISPD